MQNNEMTVETTCVDPALMTAGARHPFSGQGWGPKGQNPRPKGPTPGVRFLGRDSQPTPSAEDLAKCCPENKNN